MLAEYPKDKFTWIGDGPLLEEMSNTVRNIEGVEFIGARENVEVRRYLVNAQIYISTSKFEVLPITSRGCRFKYGIIGKAILLF